MLVTSVTPDPDSSSRGKNSCHQLIQLSAPLYATWSPLCTLDQHFPAHTPRLGSSCVFLKQASGYLYNLKQALGNRSLYHLEVSDLGALSADLSKC